MTRRRLVLVAVVSVLAVVAGLVVAVNRDRRSGAGGPGTETVVIEAPRGRILDRTGEVLVEDGTVLQVRADRATFAAADGAARSALLEALAEVLATDRSRRPLSAGVVGGVPISTGSLGERLDGAERTAVLATGIDEATRAAIEGDPDRFPGITVEAIGARTYPYGPLAAHVLGYLGRASEEERERHDLPDGVEMVGKTGVERTWDAELRGEPGRVVYQLDDSGRRVRELTDLRTDPTPGRDVHLTIDIDLQYLAEKGLAAEVERRRGVVDPGCPGAGGCDPPGAAAVAVDPRDGAVLALASYPTYDPMLFAGGVSRADWAVLLDEAGDHPLLDRASAGQVAPGSTLEPFTAHAFLAEGLVTPDEVYEDTGVHRFTADCPVEPADERCSASNAGSVAHGPVDLEDALRVSSDTYFHALGQEAWEAKDRIGDDAVPRDLVAWGFGTRTGIDLAGEAAGRIPTPEWLRAFAEQLHPDDPARAEEAGRWTARTSGTLATGQGDVLVTPIQLATAYAGLANGGTLWRPHLVLRTTDPAPASPSESVTEPEALGEIDLPAAWRDPIVAGLDGVTKAPGGTATTAFGGFDQSTCPVMAKTGTAHVAGRDATSLFAAVAPTPTAGRDSTVALAVVVEGAGFGTSAAVPVARRVLEPYAAAGCTVDPFGAPGSLWEAPHGGYFDVVAAVAEFVPVPPESAD
ncbi:MAG TPA: penicillin-binding transpeptidase domain-containing protein [Iamia sp.]|nr:penicillin-binding transpeptidase domain-containing protein [Iamia sp.]